MTTVESIDTCLQGLHEGGLYTGEEVCAVFVNSDDLSEDTSSSNLSPAEAAPKSNKVHVIPASDIQQQEPNENGSPNVVRKKGFRVQLKRGLSLKVNQAAYRMRTVVKGTPRRGETNMDPFDALNPVAYAYSSISGSTGDFEDMSFIHSRSYSTENIDQWTAAKRGDFITLQNLSKRVENPINWTMADSSGNVPLYYACRYGGACGQPGIRAVKLLVGLWPGKIPDTLLERCEKNAVNIAVSNILKARKKASLLKRSRPRLVSRDDAVSDEEDVQIDGLSIINSVIGDDGFVEDY